MPFTCANPAEPMAEDPLAATNTASAPDPDMGGDLAAAIALLAQTLAAQNIHPPLTPHAPMVPVTLLTKLQESDTFDSSDVNKL